jgi:hypothetical protein
MRRPTAALSQEVTSSLGVDVAALELRGMATIGVLYRRTVNLYRSCAGLG